MGSPSLIILLIIVVWVIVLAPLAMGNSKPIRRAGEGYEETRVLLEGGATPVATRRRPKLTAADIHRHSQEPGEEDYEVVEAVDAEAPVLIDDTNEARPRFPKRGGSTLVVIEPKVEAAPEGDTETATADTEAETEAEHYEVAETYLAPADFGYEADDVEDEEADEVTVEDANASTEDDADTAPEAVDEEDLAFAQTRQGRGGWDPRRDERMRADRLKRRQRTLLGLIIACVITLVAAVVAGGWVWVLPAIAVGLTVWFMVALRRVVKQERALRARRMRQLRRARLGVDTVKHPAAAHGERRRAGSVILDLDDASPDFAELPSYRQPAAEREPAVFGRAS